MQGTGADTTSTRVRTSEAREPPARARTVIDHESNGEQRKKSSLLCHFIRKSRGEILAEAAEAAQAGGAAP